MNVTVEISLYPLMSDFEEVIIEFIKSLKSHEGLEVYSNAMSTQITGDWDEVMDVLKQELKMVYQKVPASSTVIKIINRKLPIHVGHLSF